MSKLQVATLTLAFGEPYSVINFFSQEAVVNFALQPGAVRIRRWSWGRRPV